MKPEGENPDKNILLIHGVTYSSHEFDINYQDYSLVRKLAREGYCAWRLDIAGFGLSEEVEDGFLPDSDYAAQDIASAVDFISSETGEEKIDLLGWSRGTVTVSRYVSNHPEHVDKLVLYAPILTGIGEYAVEEAFHHNTWEHAAYDFQRTDDGAFDDSITDPVVIEMWCSSCWHYDGELSPNGGRRDVCVSTEEKLIDLTQIKVPTLIICGSEDPYLNYDLVNNALKDLPKDSALEVIEGGSHAVLVEKPYYHDFQDRLIRYLEK
jgi:pimeloyl-ACP methyl ester carboxylesterase